MTFTPQKKNPGDVLQSSDWNAAMEEIASLNDTKVNRSGQEKMSGPLTIAESLTVGEMGRSSSHLTVSGNVGVGTSEPKARLDVAGTLKLQEGVAIKKFSTDGLGNSDSSVPTETAVKTYVDQINQTLTTALGQKAAVSGSPTQNFQSYTLTAKGNLGVGTDAPRSQLEIQQDVPGKLGPILTLTNGSGGSEAGAAIDFNGYAVPRDKPSLRLQSLDDGKASSHFALLSKQSGGSANDLVERLRVTSEGNVGIGTKTPQAKLEVTGTLKLQEGVAIKKFSRDVLGNSDDSVPTESAVKAYVDKISTTFTGSASQDLQVNNLTLAGRMRINSGVIQRGGDSLITQTSDLGLYSQVDRNWVRIVAKNGPIKFFTDGGIGDKCQLTVETDGSLSVKGSVKSDGISLIKDIRVKLYSSSQQSGDVGDGWFRTSQDIFQGRGGGYGYIEIIRS